MRGLDIHKNIPVSDTKLTLGFRVGFISSHLAADRLLPVNLRVITGPPKISILFEAESTPALIIKPRIILVMHICTTQFSVTLVGTLRLTSREQMVIQNINKIVSRPNVLPGQIQYCATYCIPINLMFQENVSTNTQAWNSLSHRNDRRQRGVIWITHGCYNSNPYWVRNIRIRRSSVPPMTSRARVGPTTNWSQPDTVTKSKASTQWLFVVVEPNHSWWWPFNHLQTERRHVHHQLARQSLMLVHSQKFGHLGHGSGKD